MTALQPAAGHPASIAGVVLVLGGHRTADAVSFLATSGYDSDEHPATVAELPQSIAEAAIDAACKVMLEHGPKPETDSTAPYRTLNCLIRRQWKVHRAIGRVRTEQCTRCGTTRTRVRLEEPTTATFPAARPPPTRLPPTSRTPDQQNEYDLISRRPRQESSPVDSHACAATHGHDDHAAQMIQNVQIGL